MYRGDGCPAAYGGAHSLQPLRQLPSVRGRLPSSALYGTLWHTGLDRDDLFDHLLCERTAKERTGRSFGIPIAICGKCFAVCPYTQRYLKSE
ncbi:MAG: hypothetical protein ACLR39_00730 [Oscillospiraceae bacterium]